MKIGVIATVIASLSLAAFTVLIKDGLNKGLHPLSITASLSIIVVTLSAIYAIYKRKEVKIIEKKQWVYIFIIGFIATFLGRVLTTLGTFYTSAINAGFFV